MNIEKINEPLSVLASFGGGKIEPLRFRWTSRTYKVDRINGRWIDRQGDVYCLHYSLQSGDQIYYIHFSSKQVQWWLDQTITE